jgi:lysophospholipase L1-like esterase
MSVRAFLFLFFVVSGLQFLPSFCPEAHAETVAILGDSLSTGAATHPGLAYDNIGLWSVFRGETSVAPTVHGSSLDRFHVDTNPPLPLVLHRSVREYSGSADWVFLNFLSMVSQKFLNTEQYSWGYLVGRAIGAQPSEIYIAAENGASMEDIVDQIDKLLDARKGELPNKVFIFFTGNDLCAPRPELTTSPDEYGRQLEEGLNHLIRNGKAASGGTQVYVLGFLGVLQLISSPEILAKEVMAFGKVTTCQKLRETGYEPDLESLQRKNGSQESLLFARVIPPNPARMCPTLFDRPAAVKEHLADFGNKIRGFRKKAEEVVDGQNKLMAKLDSANRFTFNYITTTESITFAPDDIGADCFHLRLGGQVAIADAVLKHIGAPPK